MYANVTLSGENVERSPNPPPRWILAKGDASTYQMPDNCTSDQLMLHLNENHFADNAPLLAEFDAMDGQALGRYPEQGNRELCDCLCEIYGVHPDEVLIQVGCSALLGELVNAFVEPATRVLLFRPSWSFYDHLVEGRGGAIVECPLRLGSAGFEFSRARFDAALRMHRPRLAIIGSPNNPTGNSLSCEVLSSLAQKHQETVFLVDETYLGFAGVERPPVSETLRWTPNVVLLRSLSKFHGLAGIRVGFAFAHREVMRALWGAQPAFGISVVDQRIAAARLKERAYAQGIVSRCRRSKQALLERVNSSASLRAYASEANFVLVRTSPGQATAIRDHLRTEGFTVAAKNFDGQDQHLRITLADEAVMKRVAETLLACTRTP
jgi:histidinol-phosphate aminotransferase